MAGGFCPVTGDAREERDVERERGEEEIRESRVGPLVGMREAILSHVSFTAERGLAAVRGCPRRGARSGRRHHLDLE